MLETDKDGKPSTFDGPLSLASALSAHTLFYKIEYEGAVNWFCIGHKFISIVLSYRVLKLDFHGALEERGHEPNDVLLQGHAIWFASCRWSSFEEDQD